MKYYNLFGKPISTVKLFADQIDEDYEEDWHQKAVELQARRWKKLRQHLADNSQRRLKPKYHS